MKEFEIFKKELDRKAEKGPISPLLELGRITDPLLSHQLHTYIILNPKIQVTMSLACNAKPDNNVEGLSLHKRTHQQLRNSGKAQDVSSRYTMRDKLNIRQGFRPNKPLLEQE